MSSVVGAVFVLPLVLCLAFGLGAGCERQTPPPSKPPADAPTETPASKPTPAPQAAQPALPPKTEVPNPHGAQMPPERPSSMPDPHAVIGGTPITQPQPTQTKLVGITFQVPPGWVYEVPSVNPQMPQLSPKAVFRLPAVQGDPEDVYVHVTHFPGMRVNDELNLGRWYGMFTQPDGTPTKDAAKVETFEVNGVQIVLADIPGTMKAVGEPKPNQPAGEPKPDWRMLGAIIKHDHGPHFVKVVGPTRSVDHWKESVLTYLQSVQRDRP